MLYPNKDKIPPLKVEMGGEGAYLCREGVISTKAPLALR